MGKKVSQIQRLQRARRASGIAQAKADFNAKFYAENSEIANRNSKTGIEIIDAANALIKQGVPANIALALVMNQGGRDGTCYRTRHGGIDF